MGIGHLYRRKHPLRKQMVVLVVLLGSWDQWHTGSSLGYSGSILAAQDAILYRVVHIAKIIRKHFPNENGKYHGFEDDDWKFIVLYCESDLWPTHCVVPQNVHTSPTEVPLPLEIPSTLDTFLYFLVFFLEISIPSMGKYGDFLELHINKTWWLF